MPRLGFVNEIACDHLAVRYDDKDGQVWIERGKRPLPWRMVIIHREKPLKPRFWVQFEDWDFSPEISQATFEFEPMQGARRFEYFQ